MNINGPINWILELRAHKQFVIKILGVIISVFASLNLNDQPGANAFTNSLSPLVLYKGSTW